MNAPRFPGLISSPAAVCPSMLAPLANTRFLKLCDALATCRQRRKDGELSWAAEGRRVGAPAKGSLHGRWNSAALQDFSPVHVRIGSNPKLPHRNIDGRFTSINGHYVGRVYLRCRPANLLALPSLLAFTRRRRRRFRRKGWPPPTVGTPGQLTTCRRAPQECHAPPSPLQRPVVTHNRPPVAPEW
jgi:hypothetical protein